MLDYISDKSFCFLDERAYRQRQDIENPRLKKEIYVEKGRRNKFFKAVCVLYKMCLNKKYFEGFLGTEIYVYLYVKVIESLCVYRMMSLTAQTYMFLLSIGNVYNNIGGGCHKPTLEKIFP